MNLRSPNPTLSLLLAADISDSVDHEGSSWLLNQVSLLTSENIKVTVVGRDIESSWFARSVKQAGAVYINPSIPSPDAVDASGILPVFRAEQIIDEALHYEFDVVLAQGLELCSALAQEKKLQTKLWSWVDTDPTAPKPIAEIHKPLIEIIASGSRLLLTSDEDIRSQIDSFCPVATGKTRVVTTVPEINIGAARINEGNASLFIDARRSHSLLRMIDMSMVNDQAVNLRRVPRIVLVNSEYIPKEELEELKSLSGLGLYPGLTISDKPIEQSPWLTFNSKILIDHKSTTSANAYLASLAKELGIGAIDFRAAFESMETLSIALATKQEPSLFNEDNSNLSIINQLKYDVADYDSVPRRGKKTKVLLAGADFKFAGDLVDTLIQRDDIDVRVDLFKNNAHPQPEKSLPLMRWADVVIAEFASKNAIWYSRNILPHQRLIVHLHGYELLADWIEELQIDNVDQIVFASEFYRNKAIEKMAWPEQKLSVIPNSVQPLDLIRPKMEGARFHLGIVGIVPILKRPDRALDLLEALLQRDPRFVLHIKGRSPWDYVWEWKKPVHQDAYRAFYERIGSNPALAEAVVFEPFSPDMGNWLRKIGWVLSPSTRETFHLSAIEGACSGSIPIAWRREGSDEIIGFENNFDHLDGIIEKIVTTVNNPTSFEQEQSRVQEGSQKYHTPVVRNLWVTLIFDSIDIEHLSDTKYLTNSSLNSSEAVLYDSVVSEVENHDFDSALALLDEGIKLTAGAQGDLKDLELFVRGAAALDESRFTHFQPINASQTIGGYIYPLTVRVPEISDLELSLSGVEDFVIDVFSPNGVVSGHVIDGLWDIQPDRASDVIRTDETLRFNHWIEYVKVKIQQKAVENRHSSIIASGPWWLAFAVAKAADALSLPFIWNITDSEVFKAIKRLNEDGSKNDVIAEITKSVFDRADVKLITNLSILEEIDHCNQVDFIVSRKTVSPINADIPVILPSQLVDCLESLKSSRLQSPPNYLSKNFHDLNLGVIGSPQFVRSLREVVATVIEIPISGYFEALNPDFDALIIESGAEYKGAWKSRIGHSGAIGRTPTTKILDFARSLGIRSIFYHSVPELIAPKFFATARKADSVIANWDEALTGVLSLNPSSNRYAGVWVSTCSFEENLVNILRNSGVFVDALVSNSPYERYQSDMASKDHVTEENKKIIAQPSVALSDEKISAVLATFKGSSRISQMLKSIANQSLPHFLIELLVVENGIQDGAEEILNNFAAEYPQITVKYFFEELPSAGNARNRGLDEATGKYITFIDDDDYLEENYLLSMWLLADESNMVIGRLADLNRDNTLNESTPNNSRVDSLSDARMPLTRRAGLLGLNACKLIPAKYLRDIRYDASLTSGEDTVFMANLLKLDNLEIAGASNMPLANYVRVVREGSISRRPKDFDFAVVERVAVIKSLLELKEEVPQGAKGALEYLADSQASFIRAYIKNSPHEKARVSDYIKEQLGEVSNIHLP